MSARNGRRCPARASVRSDTSAPARRALVAAVATAPRHHAPAWIARIEPSGRVSQRDAFQQAVEFEPGLLTQHGRRGRLELPGIERRAQPQQPHSVCQQRTVLLKDTPHQASQKIASGRFARMALGHDKPEPPSSRRRCGAVIHSLCANFCIICGQLDLAELCGAPPRQTRPARQEVCREVSAPRFGRRGKHGFEVGRSPHAAEHRRRDATAAASDRQPLAAFGASGVEHRPPAAALHANKEAMRTGATDLGGLVGAFHLRAPSDANNTARASATEKR